MVIPQSLSPWENLPFFVAEVFLSTACTWHTSRWYSWPRSYILSSQNLRTLFGLLSCLDQHELIVHDTSVLPTQKIWILPPTLNILSSSMNRSNFTMLLHNFKRFPFSQGDELFSKVSSLDRFDYLLLCHLYSFQVQWYTMLLCVIQFFSRPVSSNAFMQLLLKP